MKKIRPLLFIVWLAALWACSSAVLKQEEIPHWLSQISTGAPPEIDLTGKWYDAHGNVVFGWGEGYLRQDQNSVSGAIGNYLIQGRVAGKTVYLVFLSGGAVYYTARLEMFEEGLLKGSYFDADDRAQTGGYPTALARKPD